MKAASQQLRIRVLREFPEFLSSKFPDSVSEFLSFGLSRSGWRLAAGGFRILLLALLLLALSASATPSPAATQAEARRMEQLYVTARTNHLAAPTDADAARRFGQACFNWAEFATNSTQRAALAEEGIAASRQAIAQAPTNGAAFYALGLNLGQLARTRTLGAIKLVSQMEKAFLQAIALDAKFDYAGPYRLLGLLYQKAPGWPASIGSKKKARLHLQKAAELAPDYADNWLCLLEAGLEWDDQVAVRKWLPQAEASMSAAKTKFTGEDWQWTRQDWDERWRKIQEQTSSFAPAPAAKAR
jgi:hypothetical protein